MCDLPAAPAHLERQFRHALGTRQESVRYAAFTALWTTHCGGEVLRTCREAVALLVAVCPEVEAVRGQVVMLASPDGDRRPWPHWWAVTPDGSIVDPTAHQFPSPIEYRPADESRGPPTGRCMHCGDLCYEHQHLCSEACERGMREHLNRSRVRDVQ